MQLNQKAKQSGSVSGDAQGYNGWTNWDTWNVMLLLDNTQESYRWLENWANNFGKKVEQGKFQIEDAEKVVAKYLIPAARGAKSFSYAVGKDFTPDPEIDPAKVNKAEIVEKLLERYKENKEYQ
jgi:hypothetical protein